MESQLNNKKSEKEKTNTLEYNERVLKIPKTAMVKQEQKQVNTKKVEDSVL